MFMSNKHKDIKYFIKTLLIVIGLVMVWRGVWHVLDAFEASIFGVNVIEYNYLTGTIGIIIGVILLYFPDRDLKEIEKL